VLALFPQQYETQIGDGAGSNVRAYGGRAGPRINLFRTRCYAHVLSTVTGRSYGVVDGLLSGAIAIALAFSPGGATTTFRKALALVIEHSVVVVDTLPPPPGHQDLRLRDARLDLFLPATPAGMARRHVLETSLHGDMEADRIKWCVVGGADVTAVAAWSKRVADAMLPTKLKIFSRTRWLSLLDSLTDIALIASMHNLLHRVLPLWKLQMKGQPITPAILMRQCGGRVAAFDVSDSDSEVDENVKPGPNTWQEWNRLQRRDAGVFARSKASKAGITITVTCLEPMVKLLHHVEYVSKDSWLQEQMAAAVGGQPCFTRAEEAMSGIAVRRCIATTTTLLTSNASWLAISPEDFTEATTGVAFCMLSRTVCGLSQLLHIPQRSWTLQIFRLLRDPTVAVQLTMSPPCMRCPFVQAFLERWDTVAKLTSAECRSELYMVALCVKFDTCDVECLHASIRRRLAHRVQTHQEDLPSASASFFLAQARRGLHGPVHRRRPPGEQRRAKAKSAKHVVRRKGKFKGKRTGGGCVCVRYCVSVCVVCVCVCVCV
jgi:hypothetical protein